MKEYILFDLDGTLLDSMPYHAKSWIETLSEFGIPFEEKEVYIHEGALEIEVVKKIFRQKGVEVTTEFIKELFERQKKLFTEKYACFVKPFPEAYPLLEELKKKGKVLGLVTSSHEDVLKKVVPEDFLNYFDIVLTGEKTERRKPHPEPYLRAVKALKVSERDVLAVENSPAGVNSAKSAGLFCVGITTTLEPEFLKPPADLVVPNHSELRKVLLNGKA
ncbi:MAG: HAD family phosphatase [Thermodesulfobacteria bacterium]|nr:HAD family phosphatase [Thermodesulfobacteriota bacterium]